MWVVGLLLSIPPIRWISFLVYLDQLMFVWHFSHRSDSDQKNLDLLSGSHAIENLYRPFDGPLPIDRTLSLEHWHSNLQPKDDLYASSLDREQRQFHYAIIQVPNPYLRAFYDNDENMRTYSFQLLVLMVLEVDPKLHWNTVHHFMSIEIHMTVSTLLWLF